MLYLDCVFLAGRRHVAVTRRGDAQGRAVLVSHFRGLVRVEEVEIVGAVTILLILDVHHAHPVAGSGLSVHRLGHDDVVVAIIVGAAVIAVGAKCRDPLATLVLLSFVDETETDTKTGNSGKAGWGGGKRQFLFLSQRRSVINTNFRILYEELEEVQYGILVHSTASKTINCGPGIICRLSVLLNLNLHHPGWRHLMWLQ